jgi:hypothetical protein
MSCNELPDEDDVFGGNCSAPISPWNRHLLSVCQKKKRNASLFLRLLFYALTGRQTGAAFVSGLQAASNSCA